jgi:hypothetical protein
MTKMQNAEMVTDGERRREEGGRRKWKRKKEEERKLPGGGEEAEEEGEVSIREETQVADGIEDAPLHRGLDDVQLGG